MKKEEEEEEERVLLHCQRYKCECFATVVRVSTLTHNHTANGIGAMPSHHISVPLPHELFIKFVHVILIICFRQQRI